MKLNQISTIVNQAVKQSLGKNAIEVINLKDLISLGDVIRGNDNLRDNFMGVLVDRIGRTVVSSRAFTSEVNTLLMDTFEFGSILQKIYVEPIEAVTDKSWNLINGAGVDQYNISKPEVKQQLFATFNGWQIDVTIPDIQVKSAFNSFEEMGTFIDAIFTVMSNSMELQLERIFALCYSNFIGERMVNTFVNGGKTVINLLSNYNTLKKTTLVASEALSDLDFLKYATVEINLYTKRLQKMSTIFNSEGYSRFTPLEYLRVAMLSEFASATASYLQADTYHKELVSLPKYNEVVFWQGNGQDFSFKNASSIDIQTASEYNVKQDGVICVMSDLEALGITIRNQRTKSKYNENGEYTNYFNKAEIGLFNDLSENFIVFVVTDEINVPTKVVATKK